MHTNLFQQELNQQVQDADSEAIQMENLTKSEIKTFIENETQNIGILKEQFESSKKMKDYKIADKIIKQIEIVEAVIEKLKYQREKIICKEYLNKRENDQNLSMNQLKLQLETEINEATISQKDSLERYVDSIENETKHFKNDLKSKLQLDNYHSPEYLTLIRQQEQCQKLNDMKGCEKLENEIKRVEQLDIKVKERKHKKQWQDLVQSKEQENKRKIQKFMSNKEAQLLDVQKKWIERIEAEKRKYSHDAVRVNKDNDRRMADRRIELDSKHPRYANKNNVQTNSKIF